MREEYGSALMIIDMLNDFAHPKGALYVPSSAKIIEPIKEKMQWMKEKGGFIVYICDAHIEQDAEFSLWPPHAIEGSWGQCIVEELSPPPSSFIIKKRRYSGFFQTDLQLLLDEKGAKELYLCGLVTDVCVLHTAADAFMRGYNVKVFKRCVAALKDEDNEWALNYMERVYKVQLL